MTLTFKEVAEILKLIDASACDEVILELEGTRLVVRRGSGTDATPPVASPAATAPQSMEKAVSAAASVRKPESESQSGLLDVRSPMVGTFYRRPSPDDAPFVEQGSKVKKGDTLCLVEVMKLFTAVEAPADGTIAEVPLEDGATIEFDQLLFRIKP